MALPKLLVKIVIFAIKIFNFNFENSIVPSIPFTNEYFQNQKFNFWFWKYLVFTENERFEKWPISEF